MDDTMLFKNRYRIPSTRLRGWYYTNPGLYFVTICTKGRYPWFGEIQNGFMCLSEVGSMVADEWMKTSMIRPYVELDRWIIMPNHMHAIIAIHNHIDLQTPHVETPRRGVSTMSGAWRPHSLGSIINQFKSICTKRIRSIAHVDFAWQPRFHDHIIRTPEETIRIRQYINDNTLNWQKDDLFL